MLVTCEVAMLFPLLPHSVVPHVLPLAGHTLLHIAVAMQLIEGWNEGMSRWSTAS